MKKIKTGIVGLGRLGKHYAENIAFRIRNAELVAACSLVPSELEWAEKEIGVKHLYTDYDEMLQLEGLDAVFIISSTDKHTEQLVKALEAGLHVFSEKPLAIRVEDCLKVEALLPTYPGNWPS